MKAIFSKVLRQTLLVSAVLSSFTLADLALAAEMTPMKPGVYTQKVVAHNGFMEVEVKLSADRIEAVKIVKSDETPYIVDEPMKQVISKVLKDQTLRVDTVSGATRSTGALLRAIGEAVEAAGGVSSEWTPDPVVIDPAKLPLADAPKADVVVIGAGASGLAAAAAAAEAGAKVVVLEKAPQAGGSLALSNGVLAAAGTDIQKASGTPADPAGLAKLWLEDQKRSVRGGVPGYPDKARVEALVKQSADTVAWLTKNVGLKFSANPVAADGIGAYALIPAASEAGKPAGAAQAEALLSYVEKKGGKVLTSTSASKLITDKNGSIAGVSAADGKNRFEFHARAVVLATGGFGADLLKITQRQPRWAAFTEISKAAKTDTGDGLALAESVGGREVNDSWLIGVGIAPAYAPMTPSMLGPRGWKGITLVNEKGERFVKEDLPVLADAVSEQRDAWLVLDSTEHDKANRLMAYFGYETVVNANNWEELARRIGAPQEKLRATMDKYNADAKLGKDTVMGRDPENFAPLTKAPFYAVKVKPVIGGTMGGVLTDRSWRVLNARKAPVKGLWATGEMANRAFYNRVYEPGTGLLIAYESGREAGAAAAKEALRK